jgi:uncharacterized SAM-binding protein YcdF (DUF218 family)
MSMNGARRALESVKGAALYCRRLFVTACVIFTAVFLVIMYTPLANRMASALVVEPEVQAADLIAVLGGGAYPNGVLGAGSGERLIRGLVLYAEGYAPEIIFSGGTIRKPSEKVLHTITKSEDAGAVDVVEAALMGEVSFKLGIPPEDVTVESASTHTYGNLVGVRDYMVTAGLGTCLVVTSPTHMYRSYRIVKKLGMDCYPAPVEDYTGFIDSAVGRLALFREVLWEYAALVLYRLYDYI